MTKEKIKKKLFEMAKVDHSSILGTTRVERMFDLEADFILGLLSEQQSKHEQEMKELKECFEKASYECWDFIPKHNNWTNFDSGQSLTTTELLTKFKNR